MDELLPLDDILEHYGVKGMRWGVRRENLSAGVRKHLTKDNFKRAGIIVGSAVGIAAIAIGSAYVQNHLGASGGLSLDDISFPKATDPAPRYAKAMAKEPVGIIHATRTKNKGFSFPGKGGLDDPFVEWERAGFDANASGSNFRRYGDRNEKVAARFDDPLGRVDRAGRKITHEVMLTENLAKGVNSAEDAKRVAWPLIKDTYGALYDADN